MLLAGPSLAHRIEAAEQRLSVSLAAAASRAGTDAFALPLAGGAAVFAGAGSPFNKVIGLGFAGPLEPADLAAIEAAYVARHAPIQVELSTLAEPSIAPLLTGRGYALVGFEDVLGRALEPGLADAARTGCDVATMTTAPGSKSQHNARRQGFELLYTRAILVRPA